jgi:acetylornithine deacetylase
MSRSISIQHSELWELSRQLVGFNTVSSASNVQAAEFLAHSLEESGFAVRIMSEDVAGVQKANVIAWGGPEVPGGLIISGHTDVVPFIGQEGWRSDALVLQSDGQHLYGRGVADMKVFLAQALVAARRHPPRTLKRPLMFLFTCDEEVAGQGAERLVRVLPDLFSGYPLPALALIGEPTNFEIFPAHKGYALFDVVVRGRGGHSSEPEKGLNAIEKMAEVIRLMQQKNSSLQERVTAENRQLFPASPGTTFNFGVISGGLAANMIADACRLVTSMRIAPGDDQEEILATLLQTIEAEVSQGMRALAPESGVLFEHMVTAPPMRSPADGAFCRLLRRVMGGQAEHGAAFATDGGHLQRIGIDSYICGPGELSQAHQPNESLPLTHLLTGQERLDKIVHEWCIEEHHG